MPDVVTPGQEQGKRHAGLEAVNHQKSMLANDLRTSAELGAPPP